MSYETLHRRRFRHRLLLSTAIAVALVVSVSGCVHRRMTVRSNPSGAMVYVDNHEIGTTPISKDFTYYGKRDIRLIKGGYETKTVQESIRAPWYQWPLIDFFSENLWPWEIRDEREFSYNLTQQVVVPAEQVIERGELLRSQTKRPDPMQPAAIGGAATPTLPPSGVSGNNELAPGGYSLPGGGWRGVEPKQQELGPPEPMQGSPIHRLPSGGQSF